MNVDEVMTLLKQHADPEAKAKMARWIASDALRELTSDSVQKRLRTKRCARSLR